MDNKHQEQELDTAICEALGMDEPEVTAGVDPKERRAMHETLARLAAASPHMKPPEELRARILEATATKTYKLEEYRKVGREDYRWYKWGFYAAAAFLILGAMYNMKVGGELQSANAKVVAIVKEANERLALANQREGERNMALSTMIDPHTVLEAMPDPNTGKPFGFALVNSTSHSAVLLIPPEVIPPDTQLQLTLPGTDGKPVAYQTATIIVPADQIHVIVPADPAQFREQIARNFNVPLHVTPGKPAEPGTVVISGMKP